MAELVTVTDIARQHDISRRTVLRMIDSGELNWTEKLDWPRTGPYLLDPDHVAAVFAARAARKQAETEPAA